VYQPAADAHAKVLEPLLADGARNWMPVYNQRYN